MTTQKARQIVMVLSPQARSPLQIAALFDARVLTYVELAFLNLARGFVETGNTVVAYCDVRASGGWEGVTFVPIGKLPDSVVCDVQIVWDSDLWVVALKGVAGTGQIVFPTLCDKKRSEEMAPGQSDLFHVIPHPIVCEATTAAASRGRTLVWAAEWTLVYPNEGLVALLEIFPELRKRVPDATLAICSSMPPSNASQASQPGVHWVYAVRSRTTNMLMDQLRSARAFVYARKSAPARTDDTGAFPMSTLAACAAGCVPVLSRAGAMPEIFEGTAVFVDDGAGGSIDLNNWLSALTAVLTDDSTSDFVGERAYNFAHNFSPKAVAGEWMRLFDQLEKEAAP